VRPRPLSITLVGWLFVLTGVIGLAASAWKVVEDVRTAAGAVAHPLGDFAWAAGSAVVAAAGGAGALRGLGWARWALAAWMGFHVGLSLVHSVEQLVVHCAIFAPLTYLLFRRRAAAFFGGRDA
jgi:hypothetical protein